MVKPRSLVTITRRDWQVEGSDQLVPTIPVGEYISHKKIALSDLELSSIKKYNIYGIEYGCTNLIIVVVHMLKDNF